MSASKKKTLAGWVRKLSYREGDFTLASGQKSRFYVDLKNTTLHPEGVSRIAELALDLLETRSELRIEAVGGLTLGADPLATAISLEAHRRGQVWPAFLVRKEAKGHGTGKYIEGVENLRAGARVLVLEDVVTTGGSSLQAVERLREAGFLPVAALTVVDREQGGAEKLLAQGIELLRLLTIRDVIEAGEGETA